MLLDPSMATSNDESVSFRSPIIGLLVETKRKRADNNGGLLCWVPEVVGHVLLAEGGVGREREVDLPRGGAADEVAAVHPRGAHREPVHVLAAEHHPRRRRRPGAAKTQEIKNGNQNANVWWRGAARRV